MMAMGRRKKQQAQMFLPTARGGGHRFYEALSKLLDEARFDEKAEALCAKHYADDDKPGRPSIAPGLYFRMLLIGYFEGIGSERGIAWRCADSMSLRDFLNLPSHIAVPDSSTVSRTRRRLPPDVFESVFQLVLAIVDEKGLFRGKVRGVDSTYLKGDASMRSIVRKDTGESYRDFIKRVTADDEAAQSADADGAAAMTSADGAAVVEGSEPSVTTTSADGATVVEGGSEPGASTTSADGATVGSEPSAATTSADAAVVEGGSEPSAESAASDGGEIATTAPRRVTAEEAVRHDRKRKKTTSNADWASPTDVDARITRMKNGTTRLAYKTEHVIDMETGAILAAEVFKGNEHDAATLESSLSAAEKNIAAAVAAVVVESQGEAWHQQPIAEVVADKGYHKASTLLALKDRGYRTFIPEKKQHGRRKFTDKGGQPAARAFHANRARTRRKKGKDHQRRRGELLERPNQHLYDRGDLRELTLTGQANVQKRVLVQAAAFNLGLVMRKLIGAGTPKWLAAAFRATLAVFLSSWRAAHARSATFSASSCWRLRGVTQRLLDGNRVSTSAC